MSNFKKTILLFFIVALNMPTSVFALQNSKLLQLKGETQSILDRCVRRNKPQSISMNVSSDNVEADASTFAYTWGTISHEDGCTWYYTQTFEERDWYLASSDIVIYDNNFEQVSSLHVAIPEDLNVNDVMPVDFLTTQFFDTDASTTELPIFVHAVDDGTQINKVFVYNLDGEVIQEYKSRSMIRQTTENGYERVLLVNEEDGLMKIDVLKAANNEEAPMIEHNFTISQDLLYYNNGPALNFYSLGGEPFYCISHFEKPCMDGFDPDTYVPTQAPDNNLIIKTYNKEYEMVDSLRISIDPSNDEAAYGFASLGMLSYEDVCIGDFTNDSQRNYIVTHYDYYTQSDEFVYHFRVYDEAGNLVKTIVENTMTWLSLSDLPGYERQYVFLKTNEKAEQILEMVDIPSCNVAAVFPAVVDGFRISTTIDRYPVGNDYQYVIGLSQAVEDENGDAIARIGWYNRDCTVDHYVTFNIGQNAEGFTPYVASYVFNPYLFNTDSTREYFYLAMNKRTDGSDVLDKTLYLATEDGKVLKTIQPETGNEVEFSSGDIFDYNTGNPKMVLSFYNGEKDAFEVQFYNLPFDKFTSGGNGSQENPYLITTPGELAQLKAEPAAHYILGNDIDMDSYDMPYIAPDVFSGSFDGNNYSISNIELNEAGLFGNLQQATIKNIKLQCATLHLGENKVDMGIIANGSANSIIENTHIYEADIYGINSNKNYIGGFLGCAANTTINAVSMLRANDLYEIENFGGIVGNLIDNSSINAAVATGKMDYSNNLGGIASHVDKTSSISNAHTEFSLLYPKQSAGIAATLEGRVEYCYATGCAYGELEEGVDHPHEYKAIVYTNNEGIVANCAEGNTATNKADFEALGFAYGSTNEAPWCGDGLPVLYFENAMQSTPVIGIDNNTIRYDGCCIECFNAQSITLYNMQGIVVNTANGNKLNVTSMAPGIYIAVATNEQGYIATRKIVKK